MEFMVSFTVEVVSVWVVIEPWVKFGTTGTAMTGVTPIAKNMRNSLYVFLMILIKDSYFTYKLTCCG